MKYELLQELNDEFGIRKSELRTNPKSVFRLGSLSTKDMIISLEAVGAIFDKLRPVARVTTIELDAAVFSMVLESIGVGEDTPRDELLSVSLLILRTPTLEFEDLVNKIAKGVHLDQVFSELAMSEELVPLEFITEIATFLNDPKMMGMLLKRSPMKIDPSGESNLENFLVKAEAILEHRGDAFGLSRMLSKDMGIDPAKD